MRFLAQLTALLGLFAIAIAFKIHGDAAADLVADFLARLDAELDGELSAIFREAATVTNDARQARP